ncbi:MAG: calcium/sodium antiporter [Lewinellaceae bacterium]|nr:calcium/sodium antiporter [Phaeodactylibacter sp.]MCB9038891.1 calcium/sodium antiporter [Lewinellaceae bacterium]
MISLLILIAGFVLLIFGANMLVDSASALAQRLKVPNIVIGLTIVAFGTSSPELAVNLMAAAQQNAGLVLGNVIGSNILNILLILGISALYAPLAVKSNTTWIEIPLAFLAALLVLVAAGDVLLDGSPENVITRSEGIVMIFFFIIFLVYTFQLIRRSQPEEPMEVKAYSIPRSILFIALGLALLVIGGHFIVQGATAIALKFGLSERLIGLTVVSIGTSLPELATSIAAASKKNTDMAIGNIVGSNIFNVFFILGASAIVFPVPVTGPAFFDLGMHILAGALLFLFIFTGKGHRLERWEGGLFLGVYVFYLGYLVMG